MLLILVDHARCSQAFNKATDKAGKGKTHGHHSHMFSQYEQLKTMGPGGMMGQYEEMNKWYCGMEANKAKKVCVAKGGHKGGPHPLFMKNHAHHKDWAEMAKGYARARVICPPETATSEEVRACVRKSPDARARATVRLTGGALCRRTRPSSHAQLCSSGLPHPCQQAFRRLPVGEDWGLPRAISWFDTRVASCRVCMLAPRDGVAPRTAAPQWECCDRRIAPPRGRRETHTRATVRHAHPRTSIRSVFGGPFGRSARRRATRPAARARSRPGWRCAVSYRTVRDREERSGALQ